MLPRLFTASTISGSGLFHTDAASRPTSAPKPTADIGCDFENTSASGPMPTSMYCDHASRRSSSAFSFIAASEPGLIFDRSVPIVDAIVSRTSFAFAGSPPACSSITRSIRLTANVTPQALIACTSHGASRRTAGVLAPARFASISCATGPSGAPGALRANCAASSRSNRSAVVGTLAVMSNTSPPRTTTTHGPSCCSVLRHTRPISSAAFRSPGRKLEGEVADMGWALSDKWGNGQGRASRCVRSPALSPAG
ncbi:hypothetical protein QFZ96_001661 [Paraburkholderia youngii]